MSARLTLKVTESRRALAMAVGGSPDRTVVVCDFSEIELPSTLAANILRAAADELDPPAMDAIYEGDDR